MTPHPAAELHVHIEGTLEPELIYELAERNGIDLPYAGLDDLRARYEFDDLQSFLDLYYANMQVLVRAQDFTDLALAYLHRAAQANVARAELFFDPQAHLVRGVELSTVMEGLGAAIKRSPSETGVEAALIACFLRDRPPAEAVEVLSELIEMGAPIIGIGLDSAERDYPPRLFKDVFDLAAAHGLHRVAHAGEEGPADYIREALDVLGVERIDHGVRCLEDPDLVARLVRDRVPLTVCPLSNVRLKGIARMEDHPLKHMLELGLNVSIHSDDPAYFGGYLDDNITAVREALGLTPEDLATLAANSLASAFR
ncbi:adenosine deaminase [Aeromicrobium duanguangcaii]|uniref:Adenine deaminase n=1 Tax=Aeromicrobium duanguangcaii TaxID=2968086 RepID=A0ABY5KDQ8_9ACTN|nr:adenosine deaminase [Aeromicrobium duanguangcaii]MCD9154515.1 adenosine deaminase [Aeromicrobium duanguangcaii]MCL3838263.1 adenosine deaminase [Aeromicrobium duanguangcaii]UUI68429.1 adenosine deaminase [Aeromicrobium duanguangcaii]